MSKVHTPSESPLTNEVAAEIAEMRILLKQAEYQFHQMIQKNGDYMRNSLQELPGADSLSKVKEEMKRVGKQIEYSYKQIPFIRPTSPGE